MLKLVCLKLTLKNILDMKKQEQIIGDAINVGLASLLSKN